MDPPQVRKKQQAKQKAKDKGQIYSQKHIRMMEALISSKACPQTHKGTT